MASGDGIQEIGGHRPSSGAPGPGQDEQEVEAVQYEDFPRAQLPCALQVDLVPSWAGTHDRVISRVLAWCGSPHVLRKAHGFLTVLWLVLWLAAWLFGWLSSVTFVSHLSAVALVLGSLSSWQSARVEVKQGNGATQEPE